METIKDSLKKLSLGKAALTEQEWRIKKRRLLLAGLIILFVLSTAILAAIHQLRFPSNLTSNVLIFAVVNLNLALLGILFLLVSRNLIKAVMESRRNILGAKFRIKLILAFIALAILPSLLLFLFGSKFITASVEHWFDIQVEQTLDRSFEVARAYYRASQDQSLYFGTWLSEKITQDSLLNEENLDTLTQLLREKAKEYNLGGVEIYTPQKVQLVAIVRDPRILNPPAKEEEPKVSLETLIERGLDGEEIALSHTVGEGDLVRAAVPIRSSWNKKDVVGVLVIHSLLYESLEKRMAPISATFKDYKQMKMFKGPIKVSLVLLFLIITLVIIFSAVWLGIYLAKGITVPIQKLAEATRAVAAGNWDYKVEVQADDEIGFLVQSFNRMTDDLKKNKKALEEANLDLWHTNQEIQERRQYTETVLDNIKTGVVSFNQRGEITTINGAAADLLGVDNTQVLYKPYREAFQGATLGEIIGLLDKVVLGRQEARGLQLEVKRASGHKTLWVNAKALRDARRGFAGLVLVVDDLTDVIKAQQAMVWREAAKRMAHEIKNPLTPIKLSAERMRKRYLQDQMVEECTNTIIQEVNDLSFLVDNFSNYARLPRPKLSLQNLVVIVQDLLPLYSQSNQAIHFRVELPSELPPVKADAGQMRQVFKNLIDNSIDAMPEGGEITLKAAFDAETSSLIMEVADTGYGIDAEDKEKIFWPHFSTKKAGMGLGLDIVARIISDHDGQIRVEDNQPRGARFIIELPVSLEIPSETIKG
jgi:two-component system nitrogen regulation sensor histidine kinase NtrY